MEGESFKTPTKYSDELSSDIKTNVMTDVLPLRITYATLTSPSSFMPAWLGPQNDYFSPANEDCFVIIIIFYFIDILVGLTIGIFVFKMEVIITWERLTDIPALPTNQVHRKIQNTC